MRFDSATLVANTIVSGSFEITGTTVPGDNSSYDLGSVSKSWRTIYSTALSGSLTKLAGGGDYLVAGTGIQLSTGSSGAVTIASSVAGSSFVSGLNTQVQFNDGGSFGSSNLLTFNKVTGALTSSVLVATGLSGSLTKLSDGTTNYLQAGSGIYIVTQSNGSILITGSSQVTLGGANTNVQFNDGGVLGGDANFTFNKTTDTLTVTNLSGSLTKLSTGGDYLIGGSGIQLSTGSSGAVTITSTVAGSSLIGGSNTQVQFNDNNSFAGNSGLTYNKTTGALTGTYVVASTGFSGSLTKLNDGSNYIVGSGGVVVTTGSNGSITMSLGTSTYTTASFTNATSVLVNHAMGTTIYDIEVFDTSYSKIIPMTATATTPTQANITFAIPTSGFIAVGGPTSGVTGAGLLQAAVYVGVNNAIQSSVVQDTPLNVQTTLYSLGSDITRPTNSRFTISGPGTYRLQGIVGLVDSVQNYSGYQWYDVTNSAYIGVAAYAEDAAAFLASTTSALAYVTISSSTTYELRQAYSGVTVTVYDKIQVEITKVTGFTSALGITQTVGSAPYYGARAWVNFNGTGTVAIRASANISSITDNGVGSYTLNFTLPMQDSNFVVMGTSEHDAGLSVDWAVIDGDVTTSSPSNSSVRVNFLGNNSAMRDSRFCFFTIFR